MLKRATDKRGRFDVRVSAGGTTELGILVARCLFGWPAAPTSRGNQSKFFVAGSGGQGLRSRAKTGSPRNSSTIRPALIAFRRASCLRGGSGQCGACSPGDEDRSSTRVAVSAWRALRINFSRSGPRLFNCVRFRAASCSRHSERVSNCLEVVRRIIAGSFPIDAGAHPADHSKPTQSNILDNASGLKHIRDQFPRCTTCARPS
jgi:hypothetical protein